MQLLREAIGTFCSNPDEVEARACAPSPWRSAATSSPLTIPVAAALRQSTSRRPHSQPLARSERRSVSLTTRGRLAISGSGVHSSGQDSGGGSTRCLGGLARCRAGGGAVALGSASEVTDGSEGSTDGSAEGSVVGADSASGISEGSAAGVGSADSLGSAVSLGAGAFILWPPRAHPPELARTWCRRRRTGPVRRAPRTWSARRRRGRRSR